MASLIASGLFEKYVRIYNITHIKARLGVSLCGWISYYIQVCQFVENTYKYIWWQIRTKMPGLKYIKIHLNEKCCGAQVLSQFTVSTLVSIWSIKIFKDFTLLMG